jgi:N-acetylglucosaminyl-diphospho-decaprenol L-rhamnosyltransferase
VSDTKPDLAVVIVSWNVRELLANCLRSLFDDLAQSKLEAMVWVVDNGSTDGSPEVVAQAFPAVHLVVSKENLGFAAGNNRALRGISTLKSQIPRYVWLLNPDTEVQAGATAALISALESNPDAGVAGARLLYADGSLQQSAFHFPGLLQLAFDLFPLPARLYETSLNGRYPPRLYEGQAPFPVDHPLGAAMMVRAETIAQVGLLDEGFWMYCEEIDWCWRMRQAGWRALCVPTAEVVHHAGRSTGQVRGASFAALWRSRLRLYDKHYPPSKRRLAWRLVRLGMRWQMHQARTAHRRGEIGGAELTARLEACQILLTL